MHLSFLTPTAALVGLLGLAALAMLLKSERRAQEVCAVLHLEPRRRRSVLPDAGALAAIGVLLALAAAQPVVASRQPTIARSDAEVLVVIDVTRSMLAQQGAGEPTRLQRAVAAAKQVRGELPDVRVGVASLTDRVLPHLFPSASENSFNATLDRAIGIDRPPPQRRSQGRSTAIAGLADLARRNFFGADARRRIAVVLTDGETVPVDLGTFRARTLRGRVSFVFIHFSRPGEGIPEAPTYRADPNSGTTLQRVSTAAAGVTFSEYELGAAVDAVRRVLGTGPAAVVGSELGARKLAPYAVAAAVLPLLFLLRRRNL